MTRSVLRSTKENYGAEYQNHLFEQYKLYVEMADRVSARRMLANSFFVAANTTFAIAFTVLLRTDMLKTELLIVAPVAALLILCYVWYRVMKSYRQLNSGKFKIVHELEQMLPVAPYDAEWVVLGKGNDRKRYKPLTDVEKWVPVCFGLLYVSWAVVFCFKG